MILKIRKVWEMQKTKCLPQPPIGRDFTAESRETPQKLYISLFRRKLIQFKGKIAKDFRGIIFLN